MRLIHRGGRLSRSCSAPVGATLGLFLGGRLADFFERLALRYSVHRVDSGAALAFVVAIAYIIRPR